MQRSRTRRARMSQNSPRGAWGRVTRTCRSDRPARGNNEAAPRSPSAAALFIVSDLAPVLPTRNAAGQARGRARRVASVSPGRQGRVLTLTPHDEGAVARAGDRPAICGVLPLRPSGVGPQPLSARNSGSGPADSRSSRAPPLAAIRCRTYVANCLTRIWHVAQCGGRGAFEVRRVRSPNDSGSEGFSGAHAKRSHPQGGPLGYQNRHQLRQDSVKIRTGGTPTSPPVASAGRWP
jgi:hypothetical protein